MSVFQSSRAYPKGKGLSYPDDRPFSYLISTFLCFIGVQWIAYLASNQEGPVRDRHGALMVKQALSHQIKNLITARHRHGGQYIARWCNGSILVSYANGAGSNPVCATVPRKQASKNRRHQEQNLHVVVLILTNLFKRAVSAL